MKQVKKNLLLFFMSLTCFTSALAYEHESYYPYFESDGKYYTILSSGQPDYVEGENRVYLTYGPKEYSGNIVIPSFVSNGGVEYKVVGITFEAFRGCEDLLSVTFPSDLLAIGVSAFQECTSLQSISIPVECSVSGLAFKDCTSLKSVTIEDGENYLPLFDNTFEGCDIESLYLGRNLASYSHIEGSNYPFSNLSSLTSIEFGPFCSYIYERQFEGCTALTSLRLTDGIKFIGAYAFKGCNSLANLIIGRDAKTIGKEAFAECDNLTNISCRATEVPSAETSAFSQDTYNKACLEVGKDVVELYRNATPWCYFSIIEGTDDVGVGKIALESAVTVFDLNGRCVLRNEDEKKLNLLSPGVYIVNSRKVILR